ncbi:MAG: FAD-binding protein, partial [Myxococcota bacterium]
MRTFTTWAGTHTCTPAAWAAPTTEEEVAAVVRRARADGKRVKVVGAGHSWSDAALTDGVMVSLDGLDRVVAIDGQRGLATVEAGKRLAAFNDALHDAGAALPIVGSIAAQSLGGLLATGTHGSSLRHGNLSSGIVGMRIVDGRGEVVDLTEGDPRLPGARVGLGALGIVTRVTLRVDRAFTVAEEMTPMPLAAALERL